MRRVHHRQDGVTPRRMNRWRSCTAQVWLISCAEALYWPRSSQVHCPHASKAWAGTLTQSNGDIR